MLKFHPLVVTRRGVAADDAIALTFALPDTLLTDFEFRAGQHLGLRAVIDDREERRTYSIVNAEGRGN